MRYIILFFIFFIPFLIYTEEIQFYKDEISYTINYKNIEYPIWKEYSKEIRVDSVFTVCESTNNSLIVFIKDQEFIAYCFEKNGEISLTNLQTEEYDFLNNYYFLDINGDNKIDFVSIWGNESTYSISIYNYYERLSKYVEVFTYDFAYFALSDIDKIIKVKDNKLFNLYGVSLQSNEKQIMKYGLVDYSKDKTKEFFFRPISITSKEQWNKF